MENGNQTGSLERSFQYWCRTYPTKEMHTQGYSRPPLGALPPRLLGFGSISRNQGFSWPWCFCTSHRLWPAPSLQPRPLQLPHTGNRALTLGQTASSQQQVLKGTKAGQLWACYMEYGEHHTSYFKRCTSKRICTSIFVSKAITSL